MNKKPFILMSVFILIFVLIAAAKTYANSSFTDIQKHWAKESIQNMSSKGYINGYPNGSFGVSKEITRAEFLAILTRIVEAPGETNPFADTSSATWANQNIGGAVKVGIVVPNEYPNNRFEPNKPITRIEMSKMIARALALNEEYKSLLNKYKKLYNGDMVFTDWKQMQQKDVPFIALTFGTGISAGYPDGSFGIKKLTNRAEAAVMLERFMNTKNKQPSSFQFLNEMKEIAETGTNAKSVSSLQPKQEHYAGLEMDHFAFNFKTKRVYVIPFYDETGVTSMYERKFIVDRNEVIKLNHYLADKNKFTGFIATVGDMYFKQSDTYHNLFTTRLFAAHGNFFFYNAPMKKYGLNYAEMGVASETVPLRGQKGATEEVVLYGSWVPDLPGGIHMNLSQEQNYIDLFFNPNNTYSKR